MKKALGLLALTLILGSCADLTAPVNVQDLDAAARGMTSNVELYKASAVTTSHYGITSIERSITILVKDLAFDKKVWVHHQKKDGTWADYPAIFLQDAGSDAELWMVSMGWNPIYFPPYDLGDKFVIGYQVNGATYWDNNAGQDYSLPPHSGYLLGKNTPIANRWASQSKVYNQNGMVYFSGSADLKNLGYTKNVKVKYTTDNWATSKTLPLNYNSTYHPSYGSPIPSPNAFGVEFWSWYATVPSTGTIKYALSYEVNGVTYWDSNFGANYTVELPQY